MKIITITQIFEIDINLIYNKVKINNQDIKRKKLKFNQLD